MEDWRIIEGTEGNYQVSNKGRIKHNDKLMSVYQSKDGYLYTHLPNRFKKSVCVHRLVAEAFIEIPVAFSTLPLYEMTK